MTRLLLFLLATFFLSPKMQAQPNFMGGLLAYYPFHSNTKDQSGNGRHGTIIGSAYLAEDRFGNSTSAYFFSGGYILANIPFDLENNYAVNAWFKANGSGAQTVFEWRNTAYTNSTSAGINYSDSRQIAGFWEEGDYFYGCYVGYSCENQYWQTKEYGDGQWHMVTLCRTGNNLQLYVDGVLMSTEPIVYNCEYYSGILSTEFLINTNNIYGELHGYLDDVMVFGRSLSAYEVAYIYYLPHSWVSPLAAEDPDEPTFCEMYPNPAQDITHLSFAKPKSYALRVFDNLGREMTRQTTHGLNHDINTSEWPAGIYSVQVQDPTSALSQTLRLVKN